jgi:choline dehydrogenase
MDVHPFACHLPVRVRFGDGAVAALPEVLAAGGARRALALVEEPVAANAGLAAALDACASAGVEVELRLKPPGEPHLDEAQALADALVAARPDALVAAGGGSALDLAKAARAALAAEATVAALLAGEAQPVAPSLPLVAVPTTSGTGSEVSGGAVLLDPADGRKRGLASPLMRASDALVDPLLTLDLPAAATANTGVDALAQGIGGVIVSNSNPLSVAIGLEACRHAAQSLPAVVRDGADLDARRGMSLASLLAGLAMNLSDCGADHALAHAAGALLGLPHGLAVGLFLAETLDVNRSACAERLERVADALGEPVGAVADGSRAVRAVRRLLAEAGLPTASAAGVRGEQLDALVPLALTDYCLTVNPRRWDETDVRRAYEDALALSAR